MVNKIILHVPINVTSRIMTLIKYYYRTHDTYLGNSNLSLETTTTLNYKANMTICNEVPTEE